MSNVTRLLKRHAKWEKQREKYYKREESNPVSSSQWQNSDDEGVAIGQEAIELLRQPVKVWTCAVKTPDSPGLVATVHATEDECFEWLRDNYDPEGDADDEPPVAIVGHLEDEGYLIHIDVHEITRP
jgi:hypothetical protein